MHAEEGLPTIHVGHGQVHQDGGDFRVPQLEEGHGFESVRRLQDLESQGSRQLPGHGSGTGFVIHQQEDPL